MNLKIKIESKFGLVMGLITLIGGLYLYFSLLNFGLELYNLEEQITWNEFLEMESVQNITPQQLLGSSCYCIAKYGMPIGLLIGIGLFMLLTSFSVKWKKGKDV